MEIKIEKGIPIPKRDSYSEFGKIIKKMDIYDSIIIPTNKIKAFRSSASYRKVKITSRKIDEKMSRIWLISKDNKDA